MTNPKIRVAYICNLQNTFTEIDKKILKDRFDVINVYVRHKNLTFLPEVWTAIRKADVIIAWFASWHSLPAFLIARALRKPCILITGGYDVANEPNINYGLRRGGLPYLMSDMVFRLSNLALPFSQTAYNETLKNTPLSPDNTQVLSLGVPDKQQFQNPTKKEAIAITIGNIERMSVKRKGIKEFVQAAQYLPEMQFIVVGKHHDDTIDELQSIASSNVNFTGYLSDEDLLDLLQRASVYVQASQHEGFGLAVAESMLARCIPVVSRNGSLPEVVADLGIYLDNIQTRHIADKISEAYREDKLGEQARQHILKNFSIEQRSRGLYNAIDSMVK